MLGSVLACPEAQSLRCKACGMKLWCSNDIILDLRVRKPGKQTHSPEGDSPIGEDNKVKLRS